MGRALRVGIAILANPRAVRHIARWTVAGQLEGEKFLRRVNGSRELVEPAYEMNPNLNARQGVA
jgi:hypothetical protein